MSTTPPAPGPNEGQNQPPPAAPPAGGQEPPGKSYDEAYVAGLRRENAAARKARQDAEARAQQLEAWARNLATMPPPPTGQPPAPAGQGQQPPTGWPPAQPTWPPAPPPAPAGPSQAEEQYRQRIFELEVKAAAAGKVNDPADVVAFLAGRRADLSSPDGDPDGRLITDAVTQLVQQKPYLAVTPPAGAGGQQQPPGGSPPPNPPPMAGSADQGTRRPPTDRTAADAQAAQQLAKRFGTPAAPTAPPAT